MKRLLIAMACGALLGLGCESQPNNPNMGQPGAHTANKPVTEEPRPTPGETAPGAPNRANEANPPPAGQGAANPQPGAPPTR